MIPNIDLWHIAPSFCWYNQWSQRKSITDCCSNRKKTKSKSKFCAYLLEKRTSIYLNHSAINPFRTPKFMENSLTISAQPGFRSCGTASRNLSMAFTTGNAMKKWWLHGDFMGFNAGLRRSCWLNMVWSCFIRYLIYFSYGISWDWTGFHWTSPSQWLLNFFPQLARRRHLAMLLQSCWEGLRQNHQALLEDWDGTNGIRSCDYLWKDM